MIVLSHHSRHEITLHWTSLNIETRNWCKRSPLVRLLMRRRTRLQSCQICFETYKTETSAAQLSRKNQDGRNYFCELIECVLTNDWGWNWLVILILCDDTNWPPTEKLIVLSLFHSGIPPVNVFGERIRDTVVYENK